MNRRTVLWLLELGGILILALAAYLWAVNRAYYHVTVEKTPTEISAFIDGYPLYSMPLPETDVVQGFGLELKELNHDEIWLQDTSLPQAWDTVRVTDLEQNRLVYEDTFTESALRGWRILEGEPFLRRGRVLSESSLTIVHAEPLPKRFRIEADLYWGRDAGVRLTSGKEQDYIALRFRPFRHGDATISLIENHRATKTLPGTVQNSWVTGLAVVTGKLLTSFWYMLALAGIGIVVTAALTVPVGYLTNNRTLERWVTKLGKVSLATLAVYGCAGLSLAISGYLILTILGGTPHVQDSVVYLFQAKIFATGKLWVETPKWSAFFEHQYVVNSQGRLYGQYPFGYPFILSLGVVFGAGWLVNPLLGGINVILIYRLAKRYYEQTTSLFAVVLLVISPFYLLMNGTFMSHSAGLFYGLSAVYLTVTANRKRPLLRGLGAGLSLTLLVATRLLTSTVAGCLLLFLELHNLIVLRRRALTHLVGLTIAGTIGMSAVLGHNVLLTGNPFSTAYDQFLGTAVAGQELGFSHLHTPANALRNLDTLTSSLMHALFPWPGFLVLTPLLIPLINPRRKVTDLVMGLTLMGIVTVFFFYMWSSICYGPRYYFEAIPAMVILSARGLLLVVDGGLKVAQTLKIRTDRAATRPVLQLLMLLLVLGFSFKRPNLYPEKIAQLRSYNVVSTAIVQNVRDAGITDAIVFVPTNPIWPTWLSYGSVFSHNAITFDGPVIYARSFGIHGDVLLMQEYPQRTYYLATYPEGTIESYQAPPRPLEPRWQVPAEVASETDRQLLWISEPSREARTTTLVFTGALSQSPGAINVYVNGEYALTMRLSNSGPYDWAANDYRLVFEPRPFRDGSFLKSLIPTGVFKLTIPPVQTEVGLPVSVRLGVVKGSGEPPLFFLFERRDTLAYEVATNGLNQTEYSIEGFAELYYSFAMNRGPTGDYRSDPQDLNNHWWL